MLNISDSVCLGQLRPIIIVKCILPQSSGKWLRVLTVVQQQSPRSCPTIFTGHQLEPTLALQRAHPADSSPGADIGMQHVSYSCNTDCGGGGGDNRKAKETTLCLKVSYWVLAGWAIGQRAVRPKLQRQYIMPLESDQLSEIGS